MPHAQRQRELIASLHLESLFDFGEIADFAPDSRHAGSAVQRRLRDLLCKVAGTGCETVPADAWQSAAACGRAADNIETWLAYLPASCVRAMVGGGWHWNT